MFIQGLSGQPLSGPDIGGFAGNATPKLFGRWMGLGALFPFSRGHTETGSIDHEPWSFGEEVLLNTPPPHVGICGHACMRIILPSKKLCPLCLFLLFYILPFLTV